MSLNPNWGDIALRLALTMVASAVIGFNRGVRGHAAGIRTTILVGLAACAAMVQANILLPLDGKTPSSFGVMDLMRLPLGILTGVGFIGGGAILKRGDLVTGVTTAATLWVATVIGLCLGGGQLVLGMVVTVLSAGTLSIVGWADPRIPRRQRALLIVAAASAREATGRLAALGRPMGYDLHLAKQTRSDPVGGWRLSFEVTWKAAELETPPLEFLEAVQRDFSIERFELTSEVRHSAS